jgi:hypothetical protein
MSTEDKKLSMLNKGTALNPNAEEFVPSSLRTVNDASKRSDGAMVVSGPSKETSTDQPESIIRSNSDEEAHQYWQQQLPDDITPDFKVLGQDETPGPDSLTLTGLSINDGIGASMFSPNQTLSMQHRASPFIRDRLGTRPKIEFSGPAYMDERSQATIMSPTAGSMSPTAAPWVKTARNGGQYNSSRRDAVHYNGDSSIGMVTISELFFHEGAPLNVWFLLAISGASLHNITDAYHGSRRSLSSTMDIMSHLEVSCSVV